MTAIIPTLFALAFALVSSTSVHAQSKATPHAHAPKPAQAAPELQVPLNAQAAVATAERFGRALKS